jgi:two-component system NtrC family sensor kinase
VKRKLIISLGLKILIFIIAGILIIMNLNIITSNHEIKEHQEKILSRYENILYNLKGAQVELYRHQAGYSRDINTLVDYVLQIEDNLSLTERDYAAYIGNALCNNCHSVQGKVKTFDTMIDGVQVVLMRYKEKISRIVTMRDLEISRPLEIEAVKDGDEIIDMMNTIRHATLKMNERMEEFHVTSIKRATYSIVVAVVVSLFLAVIIVFFTIRSITGPFNVLVRGIEKVSSGEYDSKVDINSADEIGFLAKTFNTMTDNLNTMTRQREFLMKELMELNTDLERRVREAVDELKMTHEKMLHSETLSVVGTFASGVAHELATPLASILSYLQMVKGRISREEQLKGDINLIERELQRCRDILRGMLDFARAPEQEKMLTNVNNILLDLLALIRYQTEYKNIVIKEDLNPAIPGIMAVPGQLRQVLMNVIINALQSMPERGELDVSTVLNENSQKIIVIVKDTGCGIPAEEINRIFQPFYTSKKTGTGLGLSISYGIIKGHGGDIEVKSDYGKGTTFFIYLPVE